MYYQGVKKIIVTRPVINKRGDFKDIPPLLERIFLARGLTSAVELEQTLSNLPSPWILSGMETMVNELVNAIKQQLGICIVADFDADGATSCAVAVKGLQLMGARNVSFVVPNRFEYGYGLTPEIVELVKEQQPQVIITVDNGISSIEGVLAAKAHGMKVLITDHHLPGDALPAADAIVNPNLVDDNFPGKSLAGVGVIFYVLMALRIRLREIHWFEQSLQAEPNLAQLLDFVALGTVADVVTLDRINRILVYQGLLRMRSDKAHPGLIALIEICGKNQKTLSPQDLGFFLAPRLNAAGRMDDMSLGIQCLLCDDLVNARKMALQLDELNQERRGVEEQMKHQATLYLNDMKTIDEHHLPAGVCLYDDSWHQGVVGILAARIKDRLHRPVIAFAPAGKDLIKGSARSIPGVHIRDVLCDIAALHPNLISKFGGHAMAAGLSLNLHDYPPFALAFDEMVGKRLHDVDLEQKILVDGQLSAAEMTVEFVDLLQNAAIWGQGFPEPVFEGVFDVVQARIVGQKHLKMVVRQLANDLPVDAIAFFTDNPEQWLGVRQIKAAYKPDINEFRGNRSVQFIVQYMEKIL
jgi:single-stranded-DNA-specific exonuclease